jgi:integrase
MTVFRLPYIHQFVDRHGTTRRYTRRVGCPRVALPGTPGSAEFMTAYHSAMQETSLPPSRYGNGSLGALWTAYCRSATYANLADSSKRIYRQISGPILENHGHRSVSGMKRDHARQIVEDIGVKTPAMANLTISVLRLLFSFAVDNGWRSDNPCQKLKRYRGGEFRSWTDEELSTFEKNWPLGTRERLCFDLLLYTMQRGGDVVKLKRSDIVDGIWRVTQQKTHTKLLVPIHKALQSSVKASPTKAIFIVADSAGRPIQRRTLTGIIRKAVKQAGLPADCVAHGLRKAGMRLMAENGASANQMAALSGHKSMLEVQRYTKAADQAALAIGAMKLIPDRR